MKSNRLSRCGRMGLLAVVCLGTPADGNLIFNAIDLGPLPNPTDQMTDVNDHGFVVGNIMDGGTRRPAIWDAFGAGGPVFLDGLASDNNVTRINNDGDVVGWGKTASGDERGFINHGATRTATPLADLGGAVRPFSINDSGRIVGAAEGAATPQMAFYTDDLANLIPLGTLPGHSESFARDVNAAGDIVGAAQGGVPISAAFVYDGTLSPVGTLGTDSDAFALNDAGLIVGTSRISGVGRRSTAVRRWRSGRLGVTVSRWISITTGS